MDTSLYLGVIDSHPVFSLSMLHCFKSMIRHVLFRVALYTYYCSLQMIT